MYCEVLTTSIGWVEVSADDQAITQVYWRAREPVTTQSSPLTTEAVAQLNAYFKRRLTHFDLPLAARGSDFAQAVWTIMREIPFGQTLTYGEVARRLDVPAQAVGQACGQNPIGIVIPCHRIVGTQWLGGYSSELGVNAKQFLLDLERGQGRLF